MLNSLNTARLSWHFKDCCLWTDTCDEIFRCPLFVKKHAGLDEDGWPQEPFSPPVANSKDSKPLTECMSQLAKTMQFTKEAKKQVYLWTGYKQCFTSWYVSPIQHFPALIIRCNVQMTTNLPLNISCVWLTAYEEDNRLQCLHCTSERANLSLIGAHNLFEKKKAFCIIFSPYIPHGPLPSNQLASSWEALSG